MAVDEGLEPAGRGLAGGALQHRACPRLAARSLDAAAVRQTGAVGGDVPDVARVEEPPATPAGRQHGGLLDHAAFPRLVGNEQAVDGADEV